MESSNIVGYNTRAMPEGSFVLMNIPWETANGGLNINEIFKYKSTYVIDWEMDPVTLETDLKAKAPQIQIQKPDGSAYEVYFWVKNAWLDDGTEEGVDVEGWCTAFGTYAVPTNPGLSANEPDGSVIPGAGAWFKDPENSNPSVTLTGSVTKDDTQLTCPAGFVLRGLTVPQVVNVNDSEKIAFSGLDSSYVIDWDMDPVTLETDLKAKAPQIQVQKLDGSAYEVYFYVKNAWLDDGTEEGVDTLGWCTAFGTYAVPTNPGLSANEPNGNIPVGAGMWMKGCKSSFQVTFKGLK